MRKSSSIMTENAYYELRICVAKHRRSESTCTGVRSNSIMGYYYVTFACVAVIEWPTLYPNTYITTV